MRRKAHLVFALGLALYLFKPMIIVYGLLALLATILPSTIGALIPDLDLKKKHRMLLHNVFSLAITTILLNTGLFLLLGNISLLYNYYVYIDARTAENLIIASTLAYAAGYFSHIFLDLFTIAGVAVFYPISKKRYRLSKFRSDSITANLIAYILGIGFIVLAFFSR